MLRLRNNTLLAIACIFLSTTSHSYSMFARLHKAFSKGFPAVCTGLHWYLAATPTIDEAAHLYLMKERDLSPHLQQANPAIKEFVTEQLRAIDMPNPEHVKVYMDPTLGEGMVGNNGKDIIIGYGDTVSLLLTGEPSKLMRALTDKKVMAKFLVLDESLAKAATTAEQKRTLEKNIDDANELSELIDTTLNRYKFCVQQQAVHIKEKRNQTMLAANVAAPFLTHWALKSARALGVAARMVNPPTPAIGVWRNLAKLPSGVLKGVAAQHGVYAVDRAMERNADNKVAADMDVLRAGAAFFEERSEHQQNILKEKMNGRSIHPGSAGYKALEYLLTPRHPSKLARAEHLKERARAAHLKRFDPPAKENAE